jgi:hypothetical protein
MVAPLDKTYRGRVVRLCELVGDDGVLDGFVFEDCEIMGPAVVSLQGKGSLVNSDLGGPADALLWEVPLSRPTVIGAILALNCTFEACRFRGVGFAGPPDFVSKFRSGVH